VHATAFAVSLYLPEGQKVLPLEMAPKPQGDARYEPGNAPHAPEQSPDTEPPVPYRPTGQSVHTAAFAVSLYLPAGHSAPLPLVAPMPQNEPGADVHGPEQSADATIAAPLAEILKPQPTLEESETNLTHTGLGTEMAGVAPTPG
jgi:hypothetical protein